MSAPKLKGGQRGFVIYIITSEDPTGGYVLVEEMDADNKSRAAVPEGLFGVREGLRVGGNLVREFYNNKQRPLLLRQRDVEVKRRREERQEAALRERKARAGLPTERLVTETSELPDPSLNLKEVPVDPIPPAHEPEAEIRHGVNCEKKRHDREGMLHAEDDDRPYDVDGVDYCGRCHIALPRDIVERQVWPQASRIVERQVSKAVSIASALKKALNAGKDGSNA